jgi:hypothetical protein
MSRPQFSFGTQVRRKGLRDVFVVLGAEPNGMIQIAALNWKTAAKAKDLELA